MLNIFNIKKNLVGQILILAKDILKVFKNFYHINNKIYSFFMATLKNSKKLLLKVLHQLKKIKTLNKKRKIRYIRKQFNSLIIIQLILK